MKIKPGHAALGALGILLLASVGYITFQNKSKTKELPPSTLGQQDSTLLSTSSVVVNPSSNNKIQKNEPAVWREYSDSETGLRFQYPSTWNVVGYKEGTSPSNIWQNKTASEEKTPDLRFYVSRISSFSVDCLPGDIGACQQEKRAEQKAIEDGAAPNIISFNGGAGSLTISCSANQGYDDTAPTPVYEFHFFKNDTSYLFRLNDLSTKLEDENASCDDNEYIKRVMNAKLTSITDSRYTPYNDFLTLIKQTLVLE